MDYLEYLARFLGCDYLSDLRFRIITVQESLEILSLDLGIFPLSEYQEAARYLLCQDTVWSTTEAARKAMVNRLRYGEEALI